MPAREHTDFVLDNCLLFSRFTFVLTSYIIFIRQAMMLSGKWCAPKMLFVLSSFIFSVFAHSSSPVLPNRPDGLVFRKEEGILPKLPSKSNKTVTLIQGGSFPLHLSGKLERSPLQAFN